MFVGQSIQQDGVDIVPHAEGEDAHALAVGVLQHGQNLIRPAVAFAIGQEHDDEGPGMVGLVAAGTHRHYMLQRVGDVRPTARFKGLDKRMGLSEVVSRRRLQLIKQHIKAGGEPHHGESIAIVELLNAELQRSAGLLDLLPRHRTAGIDHKNDVLRLIGLFGPKLFGGEHQDEVPGLFFFRLVRDERKPKIAGIRVVQQKEIVFETSAGGFVGDLRAVLTIPDDLDGMARRPDVLERRCGMQIYRKANQAVRLPGGLARTQRVVVPAHPADRTVDLLVAQLDRGVAARLDGKDAHLQESPADELDQPGVLRAANDRFIDLPGLVCGQNFALDHLAIEGHLEVGQVCVLGKRKDVGGFEPAIRVVVEGLGDAGQGDLIVDLDIHEMVYHAQRREGLVSRREQAGRLSIG